MKTETIACLENTLQRATRHADGLAQHIRDLEDEIRATEAKLRVANQSVAMAQAELDIELDIALEEPAPDEDPEVNGHHAGDISED